MAVGMVMVSMTVKAQLAVYPLSLGVNAVAIFILLLIKRPAKKLSAKL